jgi:hypothetical protein
MTAAAIATTATVDAATITPPIISGRFGAKTQSRYPQPRRARPRPLNAS